IGPTLLGTLGEALDRHAAAPDEAAAGLPEVWVLELSSFQLDGVTDFEPTAATVLNITQDHLDWHGSMAAYAEAKARIFGRRGVRVLNRDDAMVEAMAPAEAAAPAHAPAAHAAHWSYAGEGGPAEWAKLRPDFSTCASGTRQSPIDIRGGLKVELEPIKFNYRPTGFNVLDNGHTVQANLGYGNNIEVAGRRYDLVQFHFHRPSEERINGRQYDMVAHLVHKDPEGRLAVVAVLMDQGKQHPMVQLVWNSLPLEKNEELQSPAPIDMNLLLPEDRRYYTYMGSLTTPPCSEGVLWLVLKQPAQMSPDQLAVFARLYPMNARPIQQASGRLVKESN
ncbi:carbonic anhydrase, partial [Sphaerotilus montanus]|uniref:carbonic anhydrase n=1 Tax=Sphaerotilus montanus TaxID=522889 RepID=UPI00214DCD5F